MAGWGESTPRVLKATSDLRLRQSLAEDGTVWGQRPEVDATRGWWMAVAARGVSVRTDAECCCDRRRVRCLLPTRYLHSSISLVSIAPAVPPRLPSPRHPPHSRHVCSPLLRRKILPHSRPPLLRLHWNRRCSDCPAAKRCLVVQCRRNKASHFLPLCIPPHLTGRCWNVNKWAILSWLIITGNNPQ